MWISSFMFGDLHHCVVTALYTHLMVESEFGWQKSDTCECCWHTQIPHCHFNLKQRISTVLNAAQPVNEPHLLAFECYCSFLVVISTALIVLLFLHKNFIEKIHYIPSMLYLGNDLHIIPDSRLNPSSVNQNTDQH